MALDPAGDDLDVVDDLARAGGRRRRRRSGRGRRRAAGAESAAPGQAAATSAASRQARPSGDRRAAPPDRFSAARSARSQPATPACSAGLRPGFCLSRARRMRPAGARLHDPGHARLVGLPAEMEAADRSRRVHPGRPRLARDRGRRGRAGGDGRRPPALLAGDPASCSRSTPASVAPERGPDLSSARRTMSAPRPLAARPGRRDRRRRRSTRPSCSTPTLARIEQRNPALNAVVETFPERSREMLAAAPDGPAARRPGRDQGRVAAALAGAALRRRRDAGADRARASPAPTAPCATPAR